MSRSRARSERIPLGAYYTPESLAEVLVSKAGPELSALHARSASGLRILEPGVGGGSFARPLIRAGFEVAGVDLDPAAAGLADTARSGGSFRGSVLDLDLEAMRIGAVVGNPDYSIAQAVIEKAATARSVQGIWLLLRLGFLESQKRSEFWRRYPPRRVSVLCSRAYFTRNGRADSAAYAWFWWSRPWQRNQAPELAWIRSPDGRQWKH